MPWLKYPEADVGDYARRQATKLAKQCQQDDYSTSYRNYNSGNADHIDRAATPAANEQAKPLYEVLHGFTRTAYWKKRESSGSGSPNSQVPEEYWAM